jgi:membrane-associated protease RseP (regulator of RpoE activity)
MTSVAGTLRVPLMKIFPTRSLLLVLLLFLPSPARAADPRPQPVAISFDLLKTGHMVTKIKVNGKGPYRVIFDTGAPVTVLNNKVARESGLLKNNRKPLFTLFGSMGQVKIGTLEVGALKASDLDAIVMDHPTVETLAKAFGRPIEGIVGFPFFARYHMTLDYQAKQMTFVPNGFDPPDTLQAMMTTLASLSSDKPPPAKILAPAAQWGLVVSKQPGDDEPGVTIKAVLPGGAAAAGGLKPGDRLLTLDGRWTDSVLDCYAAAGFVKPGATAIIVIRRDGQEKELTVKPASGL